MSWSEWLPPRLWTCIRCSATILTREAGPQLAVRVPRKRLVSRQRALRALYEDFNARFFEGRLPHAQRELTIGGDPFKRGISVRRVGVDPFRGTHGLRCKEKGFTTGLFRRPSEAWPAGIRVLSPLGDGERRVLLHEMAHAAVWFAGGPDKPSHGPRFIAELERLATLGEAWAVEDAARYRAELDAALAIV